MARIGFVGLGAMGAPMARNLLAKGFAVRGFDTRTAAVEELVAQGRRKGREPAAAHQDGVAFGRRQARRRIGDHAFATYFVKQMTPWMEFLA